MGTQAPQAASSPLPPFLNQTKTPVIVNTIWYQLQMWLAAERLACSYSCIVSIVQTAGATADKTEHQTPQRLLVI